MKKLILIISFLVLVLILNFTPACGKAINASDKLIEACISGNLEEAERLLEQGVNVNAKDYIGRTALIWASNCIETVDLLEEEDAIE